MGESGEFYRDTTKIIQTPNKAISNDRPWTGSKVTRTLKEYPTRCIVLQ